MPRWPISDERAREMYDGGRANSDARWFARFWGRLFGAGVFPRRWVTLEVPGRISGDLTSFPLGMADLDGRWYLVSMLGGCQSVKRSPVTGARRCSCWTSQFRDAPASSSWMSAAHIGRA